jgi:hypothetical protein
MAGSLNRVMLMGRLTKDPELRHTPSGAAVCQLAGPAPPRTLRSCSRSPSHEPTEEDPRHAHAGRLEGLPSALYRDDRDLIFDVLDAGEAMGARASQRLRKALAAGAAPDTGGLEGGGRPMAPLPLIDEAPSTMTAHELRVLVKVRFPQSEWALLPQVGDAAGFNAGVAAPANRGERAGSGASEQTNLSFAVKNRPEIRFWLTEALFGGRRMP